MKIGFDVSQTGRSKAGCGYFADSLIRHLAQIDAENQYILYPTFGGVYWDPDWASGTCRISNPNFRQASGHKTLMAAQRFWNHPPAAWEMHLGNPDIIHSNNFFCPRRLPKARLVYTLYDLSFLVNPEWTTEENRTGCFDGVFQASLYADLIISISHYSRNHFLEVFPHYPKERIAVVHPASRFQGEKEIPMPRNLPPLLQQPFWLNVGVIEPRKNQHGLLRAYALLKANLKGTYPLAIAGGKGWLMDDFEKELKALHLEGDVVFLGYVDNDTLQWLYQHCYAFIYPSLFEGFGLPILEAMGMGAPVIASNVSSIPEIVGQAGFLIDPKKEETIYQAMRLLAMDNRLRQKYREKSRKQANLFSWQTAAAKVLECYREVMLRGPLPCNRPAGETT